MSFPANSRYQATEVVRITLADGTELACLKRRFVPSPERLAGWQQHTVVQGDRLDNLAARYLGDAELFWRLCDANRAMRPGELTDEVGRRLQVALPDGLPGAPLV